MATKRRQKGKILPTRKYRVVLPKVAKLIEGRDFPNSNTTWDRKGVCRRCYCVMRDAEPLSSHGEFWHPSLDKEGKPHWCKNVGKVFTIRDTELLPFMSKKRRRYLKRAQIRA